MPANTIVTHIIDAQPITRDGSTIFRIAVITAIKNPTPAAIPPATDEIRSGITE